MAVDFVDDIEADAPFVHRVVPWAGQPIPTNPPPSLAHCILYASDSLRVRLSGRTPRQPSPADLRPGTLPAIIFDLLQAQPDRTMLGGPLWQELHELHPSFGRSGFQMALAKLARLQLVENVDGGGGRRRYRVRVSA